MDDWWNAEKLQALSFMPNPRSVVKLRSGEYGIVCRVTPKGDDDRVVVVRETWGVPKVKQVRITPWLIDEIVWESEEGEQ